MPTVNDKPDIRRAGPNTPISNGEPKPLRDAKSPLAISVSRFCELTSLGRTTAFQLARDGKIENRRAGGRTLILMRSVCALLGVTTAADDHD